MKGPEAFSSMLPRGRFRVDLKQPPVLFRGFTEIITQQYENLILNRLSGFKSQHDMILLHSDLKR
jgi:hypothetical protein